MFAWERKQQLTPRMKEVIELRRRRFTNKEIAEMKGVSLAAIEKLCVRILRRTGYSRVEQVNYEN